MAANVVVSKQGDGQYTTLADAVKNIPINHQGTYIIQIKAGVYDENVTINNSNITLLGDGKGKTIFRSSRNKNGGFNISVSGAVVLLGDNFFVKDITFENTSDPANDQAVALYSKGDKSVFYLCEFIGHQDTLYVNGNRQFFRECDISGTIDFIFGDAAMILQKCNIKFRQPVGEQTNTMTAQGRTDPNLKTAIVVHDCQIIADNGFVPGSVPCYLGRPWKQFSRTIVMQSCISNVIDPAGWLQWPGQPGYFNTLDYEEFGNGGPGSYIGNRVNWPGRKKEVTANDVLQFTVTNFINGDQWLPATGVPFTPGFLKDMTCT
ncbi:pectinesterase 2-like [Dioscorea cayenensis subsp. rotundata]|uniref:Pectinesterase n=1 Tax=Dioscorea cayennensis subsp. rotundata TaxID=55577 RepID=A0AB40CGC3_DIOCR|nr:pectinesterase 2-like [Dioscorea cayenensis subsp. rotundata]